MRRDAFFGDDWHIPNPESGIHYHWAAFNARRLSQMVRGRGKVDGYSFVPATKCEQLGLPAAFKDTKDNRIRNGDNVLMCIDMAEYEKRLAGRVTADDKLRAAKDAVHATTEGMRGIRSFEEDPDETADKAKFHRRDDRPFSGQTGVGRSPVLRRTAS